jgi:hypothetical protein
MQNRVKYPLTDEAKAKEIAEYWKSNPHDYEWKYSAFSAIRGGINENFRSPQSKNTLDIPRRVLKQLEIYGLIRIDWTNNDSGEVLFLQELKNAVEHDFTVSAYFLSFDSEALANSLSEALGNTILEGNQEIANAISELKDASEEDKQSVLGKVIMQLGHGLKHGTSTTSIVLAIFKIAEYLQQ